ncbi:MAG: hypothetical protein QME60_01220 [Verrucomicrobiota bacterium]|nr:hypothetical protein [Verrucomicrobiota bacterium]
MKLFRIVLITFGILIVLMVVGSLMLQFKKRENITTCGADEKRETMLDGKEETKKKELVLPKYGIEKLLSNEAPSSQIAESPVAQQLSNLSFSYALESVDSLKNASMRDRLRHNLEAAKKAKEELEELEKNIQGGKIQKKLVHGRWLVVVINDNETKCIFYHSPDGPIRTYTKNVYAENDRKNELHELGYELEFHLNGRIKSSVRRDLQEMLEYHPSGRLKNFAVETWDGGRYTGQQYMASWDMNGKLLHENIGDVRYFL